MLVLNASEVRQALPMREAIQGMKRAFAALSDARAEVPLRGRLPIPAHDALMLLMPAYVTDPETEALAVKVVSLFPGNPERGLAYIQAAVLVLEPDTGKPVGILEGTSLTAIRTGAASGAAVDLLARPDCSVLAVFGAGVQGRTQLEAACSLRNFQTVWIYDSVPAQAQTLADELASVGSIPRDLRVAASPGQALTEADVICTATTSRTPVFADSDVQAGAHISAVGSYLPEMQELPAETVARARLIVDSRTAVLAESGDLIQPIQQGRFTEDHIAAELGEIVLGRAIGRQSEGQVTVFKSVGVAAQDAVAAGIAMRNAMRLGIGQEVRF